MHCYQDYQLFCYIGIRDAVNCMLDEVPQTRSIESRFNSIEDSLEQVNSIPSIESRLYLLENSETDILNEPQGRSVESAIYEITNELADRQQRSSNLVLHNVPEMNSLEDDVEVVKCIIDEVVGKEVEIQSDSITGQLRAYRLGRKVLGKTRSNKVHLRSKELCQDILTHSRNLTRSKNFSKVVLQADLTTQQRSHLKKLVIEKRQRNNTALENHEDADWVIRFGKLCRKRDIYQ